jgi:hypothetical protein
MATEENKKTSTKSGSQEGFVYLPLIAGWLVPGGGHFLLRKWGRGALLAASILGMFVLGLLMQGKVYAGAHDILDILGLAGDLGNGLPYVLSRMLGLGDVQVMVTTADWGTRFIVVAGLLNIIAAVDAQDREEILMGNAIFQPSHFAAVVLFALFASTVFGITQREKPRDMIRYGIYCFVLFVAAAIVLSWLMYFIAR